MLALTSPTLVLGLADVNYDVAEREERSARDEVADDRATFSSDGAAGRRLVTGDRLVSVDPGLDDDAVAGPAGVPRRVDRAAGGRVAVPGCLARASAADRRSGRPRGSAVAVAVRRRRGCVGSAGLRTAADPDARQDEQPNDERQSEACVHSLDASKGSAESNPTSDQTLRTSRVWRRKLFSASATRDLVRPGLPALVAARVRAAAGVAAVAVPVDRRVGGHVAGVPERAAAQKVVVAGRLRRRPPLPS